MAFDAGAIVSRLQMDRSSFSAGIVEANGMTELLGTNISSFLANPLLGVANAAKDALGWVKELVTSVSAEADKFAKLSFGTGTDIEFLSGLAHAAELSGTSIDEVTPSYTKLARIMDDVARGGGAQKQVFDELGIAVADLNGELRPVEEVFLDLADAIAAETNATERNVIARRVFEEQGTRMVPLLAQGRDGIREMIAEAKRLGITFDAETAASAERLNDSVTRLSARWDGFKRQIADRVITEGADLLDALQDDLDELAKVLGEAIVPFLEAIGPLLQIIGANLKVVGEQIKFLDEQIPGGLQTLTGSAAGLVRLFGGNDRPSPAPAAPPDASNAEQMRNAEAGFAWRG